MDTTKKLRRLPGAFACLLLGPFFWPALAESANEYLEMDISQLMNITITSVSKKEQKLSDAAAAVFVITQEDIQRSGVTHIAEALAMAPGLQVARIGASKWSVSSRGFPGFTSNKLLVLLDGRSVYSPAYGGTFWDTQNTLLEDIDRIEVIRGPGGTLWGANAVNGVINIITRKSTEVSGGLVRLGLGDQETLQGGARYGWKINDAVHGRIYATYTDQDSNKVADIAGDTSYAGLDANDDWQSFQTGFRFDGQARSDSEWTLQGDVYSNVGDQIIVPYWIESPPYLSQRYGEFESSGGNILGRYRHEIGTDSAFTVQTYYDYANRDDNQIQLTFHIFDVEVQYEKDFGRRNSVTVGGGFRNIDGSFESTSQVKLKDRTDQLYSVFLQDELMLVEDKLWFIAGIKGEHNDYTGFEWQPSARLLYKPLENHTLWTSVARSVRTPSVVEHGGSVLAATFPTSAGTGFSYLTGGEEFDSEIVRAYEIGYRWQTSLDLSLDLAAFYNEYEDLYSLDIDLTGQDSNLYFANKGEGDSYGLELAADWRPTSWLAFNLAYSYLKMDFTTTDSETTLDFINSFLSNASPQHQVSLRSSIKFAQSWQANVWLRYIDEIDARNSIDRLADPIQLEDYWIVDLNLSWKATNQLEVMLVGQNLFNDGQLQYISEYGTPATEIQPSVYLKMMYHF